jgi:hypothetical protein
MIVTAGENIKEFSAVKLDKNGTIAYNIETKVHEMKIAPKYHKAVIQGIKTFEIRKNDRNFKEGDIIILKPWLDGKYIKGKAVRGKITYITDFAQQEGYVVFSFVKLKNKSTSILKDGTLRVGTLKCPICKAPLDFEIFQQMRMIRDGHINAQCRFCKNDYKVRAKVE